MAERGLGGAHDGVVVGNRTAVGGGAITIGRSFLIFPGRVCACSHPINRLPPPKKKESDATKFSLSFLFSHTDNLSLSPPLFTDRLEVEALDEHLLLMLQI